METATRTLEAGRSAAHPDGSGSERQMRLFRYAAAFYLLAWAVHTADHIRRGLSVVTTDVAVLGAATAVLQLLAVLAALTQRRRWVPLAAALIGFPDAAGIAAVHFLPRWSSFSDAFPGARGTGVTGFSWFAAALEVSGALAFGAAGAYTYNRLRIPTRPSAVIGREAP